MANDNDDNQYTEHILTLKEQVLRWAAPKLHQGQEYGTADEDTYGHVKFDNTISANGSNPVTSAKIFSFVNGKISSLRDELQGYIGAFFNIITSSALSDQHSTNDKYNIPTARAVKQAINNKFNIDTEVSESSTHETNSKNNIPTSKAVWDAISSYESLLEGVSLAKPKEYSGSIDSLITPGYYLMTKTDNATFTYNGGVAGANETVYYTNALVTVKKVPHNDTNRVVQHVHATENNNGVYKTNGNEYTRYRTNTWSDWAIYHKPRKEVSRVASYGRNVDNGSVKVFENTSGFVIRWQQTNSDQQKYSVYQTLYEYATVCTFNPPLPIDGPYVFGNLIGRMDIRITPNKMEIRSNVPQGGRIIGMDETYFVPRKQ